MSAYKFLALPPAPPATPDSSGLKEIKSFHMCSSAAVPGKVQKLLEGKVAYGKWVHPHLSFFPVSRVQSGPAPRLLLSWEGYSPGQCGLRTVLIRAHAVRLLGPICKVCVHHAEGPEASGKKIFP